MIFILACAEASLTDVAVEDDPWTTEQKLTQFKIAKNSMRLLMHGVDLKDKLVESSTNINREAKHVTIAG